jgi:SAM-dependent methyltransferase
MLDSEWMRATLSTRRQQAKDALDRLGILGVSYAVRQGLRGARPRVLRGNVQTRRTSDHGLPVPPLRLIFAVAGHFDRRGFLDTGRDNHGDIVHALRSAGSDPDTAKLRILDFGCGCGRVLRYWSSMANVDAHGVDPNPKQARWCQENLRFATIKQNDARPPLDAADGSFDAIYVISVFTHITVDAQHQWVAELTRVLTPGGHLVVTTHGAAALRRLGGPLRANLANDGVVVLHASREGTNLCATYHSEQYMRSRFAPDLDVVDFVPKGLRWSTQDITIFRKP